MSVKQSVKHSTRAHNGPPQKGVIIYCVLCARLPPGLLHVLSLVLSFKFKFKSSSLWRVSSWSLSRSCSFRCVSSSPSTLTPTA